MIPPGNIGEVIVPPPKYWFSVTDAAKELDLGMGERQLYKYLRDNKIIHDSKNDLMKHNTPLPEYENLGLFQSRYREYGITTVQNLGYQLYISRKGIDFIRELFNQQHGQVSL